MTKFSKYERILSCISLVDLYIMSEGRQTPENGGPDQGPADSDIPTGEIETSKKASTVLKTAFDDGALKVMEDEFQVRNTQK